MKKTAITQEVLDVLRHSASVEGNRIVIGRQLDRKLYVAVDKVLQAMGGKWDRKGHAFAEDPTERLRAVVEAGEIVEPKKNGFFPTPRELAEQLVREAALEPGMRVLEPSAGRGDLAEAIEAVTGPANIQCAELLPDNVKILEERGFAVWPGDFLQMTPRPIFDRVIMNPPFENLADIDHVNHAWKFLKPGGRLVAIMGAGVEFRQDKMAAAFRAFVEESGGWWQANPEGSFKASGTMVNTVMVLVEGPPPAESPAELVAEERSIPLERIFPNPDQPRKLFDAEALQELAENIRRNGILQPLVVVPRGDRYMIIAGERRWRASQLAGRMEVPVRIIEADDAKVQELALIENLLRRDLTILEEARAYQDLLDRGGYSVEDLAAKLGMKQAWRITERTSLLNLAPEYQELVAKGSIGNSQAFEMSRVDVNQQRLVFRKIAAGELNSYAKLRAFVDGLLNIGVTSEMFAPEEITEEERQAFTRYEKTIEKVLELVGRGFSDNEIVAVRKMLPGNLDVNLQRIDLIIRHLQKIQKAMTAARMQQEALDMAS